MSIQTLFFDGFEDVANVTDVLTVWDSVGNTSTSNNIISGRNGNGFKIISGQNYLIKNIATNETDFIVGFAIYFDTLPNNLSGAFEIIADSTIILTGVANSSGSYTIQAPLGGTTYYTTPNLGFAVSQWSYIEIGVHCNSGAGYFYIQSNGSLLYSSPTNLNTGSYVNQFVIQTHGYPVNPLIDDVYAKRASTPLIPSDFNGDCFVVSVDNTGDGDQTAWSIAGTSPAATRWESVNESTPDYGVTTIQTGTDGAQNLFTHATLPTIVGGILSVAPSPTVQKVIAGSATIQNIFWNGSTTQLGTKIIPITSFKKLPTYFDTNPFTASVWQPSDLTGLQYGVQRNDN